MQNRIYKTVTIAVLSLASVCMGRQSQEESGDVLMQPDMSESYYTGKMPVHPASAVMQQHITYIESLMREHVNARLTLREIHYAVGIYGTTQEVRALEKLFSDRAKTYIAGIQDLAVLESLCRYWWLRDEPEDMPMSLWTDDMEIVRWFLCEKIAQFGTQEAYETLLRLRNDFADGAWGGWFRSLEWRYLRPYSQDPAVQKSKTGVFI